MKFDTVSAFQNLRLTRVQSQVLDLFKHGMGNITSNVATAGKLDKKLQDDVTNRTTRLPEHVKAKHATKKTFKVVEGLIHTIWYNVSEHSTRRTEPLEARIDTAADGTFYISQVSQVINHLCAHA